MKICKIYIFFLINNAKPYFFMIGTNTSPSIHAVSALNSSNIALSIVERNHTQGCDSSGMPDFLI